MCKWRINFSSLCVLFSQFKGICPLSFHELCVQMVVDRAEEKSSLCLSGQISHGLNCENKAEICTSKWKRYSQEDFCRDWNTSKWFTMLIKYFIWAIQLYMTFKGYSILGTPQGTPWSRAPPFGRPVEIYKALSSIVYYTAVSRVVTQRSTSCNAHSQGGALRGDTKNRDHCKIIQRWLWWMTTFQGLTFYANANRRLWYIYYRLNLKVIMQILSGLALIFNAHSIVLLGAVPLHRS